MCATCAACAALLARACGISSNRHPLRSRYERSRGEIDIIASLFNEEARGCAVRRVGRSTGPRANVTILIPNEFRANRQAQAELAPPPSVLSAHHREESEQWLKEKAAAVPR